MSGWGLCEKSQNAIRRKCSKHSKQRGKESVWSSVSEGREWG